MLRNAIAWSLLSCPRSEVFGRLPLAIRDLDDSSPTVRFTSVAHSRLREIWVHHIGRAHMGRVNRLAMAHGEEPSKVRVADHPDHTPIIVLRVGASVLSVR